MNIRPALAMAVAASMLAACSNLPTAADPQIACSALAGTPIAASAIGLPSGPARVASALLVPAAAESVTGNAVTPATPEYCKVLGSMAPLDAAAQPIHFQLNLPTRWNGKALQYGGGGFNGVLVTGLAPQRDAAPGDPLPIMRGYATFGTDSGHQASASAAGEPGAFALNDEMLENFAFASYKKVRDVAVALARSFYGRAPARVYYFGGSEGGREGLAMAQRFPADYDGIVSVDGSNWIRYAIARNASFDVQTYRPESFVGRVQQTSALMDATNPDLSAFFARGGKVIVRENAADRAQSPLMGIEYHQAVIARLGQAVVDRSMRLYVSPSSTHAGNARSVTDKRAIATMADLIDVLDRWVNTGSEPADMIVQTSKAGLPPFELQASRPMCRYPGYPRYIGGDRLQATSYACRPSQP